MFRDRVCNRGTKKCWKDLIYPVPLTLKLETYLFTSRVTSLNGFRVSTRHPHDPKFELRPNENQVHVGHEKTGAVEEF